MACFVLMGLTAVQAQLPKTVSVGLINMSERNVIVQGYTVVNNVKRLGQPLQINKKASEKYEANVPAGVRFYTVYDANQPARILLKDFPVPIQNRDVMLKLVPSPTNPKTLVLVPAD